MNNYDRLNSIGARITHLMRLTRDPVRLDQLFNRKHRINQAMRRVIQSKPDPSDPRGGDVRYGS